MCNRDSSLVKAPLLDPYLLRLCSFTLHPFPFFRKKVFHSISMVDRGGNYFPRRVPTEVSRTVGVKFPVSESLQGRLGAQVSCRDRGELPERQNRICT